MVWTDKDKIGLKITFVLLSLQIIHLYWLTTNVILPLLGYDSLNIPQQIWPVFIVADFLEIPAIVSGVIFYVTVKTGSCWRNMLMLSLLGIQVFHIFWITDDVVLMLINQSAMTTTWPIWLAWSAILVDFLEIPVIIDLGRRLIHPQHTRKVGYYL